jgi:hypothetical protein
MPSAGFEPTISAGERPQTLDRTATGIGESSITTRISVRTVWAELYYACSSSRSLETHVR